MNKLKTIFFPFISVILVLTLFSCTSDEREKDVTSEEYRDAVSSFYLGIAASQTDEALFASTKMEEVVESYPREPAAWTNLGVFALRQGNYELASERLELALELAPGHPDILFLSGILESRRGDIERSVEILQRAADAPPQNLKILHMLASEMARLDVDSYSGEIRALYEKMHSLRPDNQVIILEMVRIAVREENVTLASEYLERIRSSIYEIPDDISEQLAIIDDAISEERIEELTVELAFLENAMSSLPEYQASLAEVQLPTSNIGFVLTNFIGLPEADVRAAEPDTSLAFNEEELEIDLIHPSTVKSVVLTEEGPPQLVTISGNQAFIESDIELDFPGGAGDYVSPHSIAEFDYNYSFLNDLVLAGDGGLRLYQQNSDGTFDDVTSEMNLPQSVTGNTYFGVWPADISMDGDLDLVLAPLEGAPVVLRNNGDGTFTPLDLFPDVEAPVYFHWADLDADSDPDAVFLDREGRLQFYMNERTIGMVRRDVLPVSTEIAAITVADINADSHFDIMVLKNDYSVHRVFYNRESGDWLAETLAEPADCTVELSVDSARLFTPDLDNNGRFDLLATSPANSRIWLADETGNFKLQADGLPGGITSVTDLNGNERLDLLGISENQSYQLLNSGDKNYGSRSIRVQASGAEGDQRINSYGIGGEMEVRSGLLYQKQQITNPIVHFGLGMYDEAEMLRIIWPNGSVQAEFAELGMGTTIFNEQILKGSCPWLFTNNGEGIQFITDILWRSPLGLRINDQETAGVVQTEDRVKIPGEMLIPTDGYYDVRVTAELWETHFFDYVNLIAVDHPEGTEMFIDERFAIPPPDLDIRLTKAPEPVAGVRDDKGNDVSDIIKEIDGKYLAAFEKTKYQGVVKEHHLEVELGDNPPKEGPLWLLASGWIRPTDSSINVALSQGSNQAPKGLKVEVPNGKGSWETVHADMGFPAGKTKTIMIDLQDIFPDNNDRRLRLTTTTEIYWDAIRWAEGLDESEFIKQNLQPGKMELAFRGYSEWNRADSLSPKLPNYNIISGTAPRWSDLVGHYTRFGDVTELLERVDDRYVIMNAGDEMKLRFTEAEAPAEGMTRSFVFVSDGWEKDGDYNTIFSKTVLPLPSHNDPDYNTPPGTLFDDPIFRQNKQDWVEYHTRYVTPDPFRSAINFSSSDE